jgi:hypothetical protein
MAVVEYRFHCNEDSNYGRGRDFRLRTRTCCLQLECLEEAKAGTKPESRNLRNSITSNWLLQAIQWQHGFLQRIPFCLGWPSAVLLAKKPLIHQGHDVARVGRSMLEVVDQTASLMVEYHIHDTQSQFLRSRSLRTSNRCFALAVIIHHAA